MSDCNTQCESAKIRVISDAEQLFKSFEILRTKLYERAFNAEQKDLIAICENIRSILGEENKY